MVEIQEYKKIIMILTKKLWSKFKNFETFADEKSISNSGMFFHVLSAMLVYFDKCRSRSWDYLHVSSKTILVHVETITE